MGIPAAVGESASAGELGELLAVAVARRRPRLLRTAPVYLYEEGLVSVPGARARRWEQVTDWRSTIDLTLRRGREHGPPWYAFGHRHLARFADGSEHSFVLDEWRLHEPDEQRAENAAIRAAVHHVRRRVGGAQAPALLARLDEGRQVAFGRLTADARGLWLPRGRTLLPWSGLEEPTLAVDLPDPSVPRSWWAMRRDASLTVRGADEDGVPHSADIPAWQVVNWGALVTLWGRLHRPAE
ncbi:hypothetical protein ACWCQ1_07125 [Streptomyces sp. NPDC002144]|uniref:hypothetical protein n=1 Tax=Streptomyces sp. NPDC006668 TaxID=3156903 RepID=UPI001055BF50